MPVGTASANPKTSVCGMTERWTKAAAVVVVVIGCAIGPAATPERTPATTGRILETKAIAKDERGFWTIKAVET
jgi:hypothetical protein